MRRTRPIEFAHHGRVVGGHDLVRRLLEHDLRVRAREDDGRTHREVGKPGVACPARDAVAQGAGLPARVRPAGDPSLAAVGVELPDPAAHPVVADPVADGDDADAGRPDEDPVQASGVADREARCHDEGVGIIEGVARAAQPSRWSAAVIGSGAAARTSHAAPMPRATAAVAPPIAAPVVVVVARSVSSTASTPMTSIETARSIGRRRALGDRAIGRITRIVRTSVSARLDPCRIASSPPSIRKRIGSRLAPRVARRSRWSSDGAGGARRPSMRCSRRWPAARPWTSRASCARSANRPSNTRSSSSGDRAEEHPRVFTAIRVEHRVRGAVEPEALRRSIELSATTLLPGERDALGGGARRASVPARRRIRRRARGRGDRRSARVGGASRPSAAAITTRCAARGPRRAPPRPRRGTRRDRRASRPPGRSAPAPPAARGWRPRRRWRGSRATRFAAAR